MLMHVRCFAKHNDLSLDDAYHFIRISIKLGDRGFWLVDPRDVWSKTLAGTREIERIGEYMEHRQKKAEAGVAEGS